MLSTTDGKCLRRWGYGDLDLSIIAYVHASDFLGVPHKFAQSLCVNWHFGEIFEQNLVILHEAAWVGGGCVMVITWGRRGLTFCRVYHCTPQPLQPLNCPYLLLSGKWSLM